MKRITLFIAAICYSVALMAQTPQEVQQLRKLIDGFAFATSVEQVDANTCKITLSSGENFTLLYGKNKKDKNRPFKSVVVKEDAVTAKPHKGKPIVISRKLDQTGALMAIYTATEGKNWTRNEGWGNTKQGLDTWEGITCDSEGNVTNIKLKDNNLQGNLPDVFYAFPKLKKVDLRDNKLTGQVPRSLVWTPDGCKALLQRNMFSETTIYVPRQHIATAAQRIKWYPQNPEAANFRLFIDCDVDLNPVNGHYADNECVVYNKATEGTGIDIYIIGDGYDKAECAKGGTAEYWLERTAEDIFKIRPYSQLKHLFNVYIIYAYSQERGISLGNSARYSRFGNWMKRAKGNKTKVNNQELYETIKNSVTKAGHEFKDDENEVVYIFTAANTSNGSAYVNTRYAKESDGSKRKMRVALVQTSSDGYHRLVWHEFCGHAYGSLRDEYNRKGGLNKTYKKTTTSANVDLESDPKKVKWAKFIEDPRYTEEKIGVYQGSLNCANLYRATKTSIMRDTFRKGLEFNAPSRAAIYKKIMKQAFPGWEFDYEEFVKFDMGDKYYPLPQKSNN
uniref:M64 family metallopeptidase n=1 Tax=Alistipes sp. TaxID=1872444 RepID=UPI004056AD46